MGAYPFGGLLGPAQPPMNDRLIHDCLISTASEHPDRIAVVAGNERRTFRDLLHSSLCLARGLQDRGVSRGDRVVIRLENSWESAVSIFGVLLAGAVNVVVNPRTAPRTLLALVGDSEASAVIVDDRGLADELVKSASLSVRHFILVGEPPLDDPGLTSFETLLETSPPTIEHVDTIPLDLAGLIYTSGSTGEPKGAMMTHQSMVFTRDSVIEYLRLGAEDRVLSVLPLAFSYGLYQLFMSVKLGIPLILERSFDYPMEIVSRIREERATVLPGVPTMFARLVAMHARTALRLDSLTCVTNAAAALRQEFVAPMKEIFPNARIYKMYGMTECKRVCYLEPELIDEKPFSVGKAIPGVEVLVLGDDGEPVPPGTVGTLHVRGANVMLGYWKKPDLTAHMLKEGRYPGERILCTHDRFKIDREGFLYFVGRSDDIIKTRGEKVSPVEVENVLHGIPGVQEASVIGVPDDLLGEAVRAYLVTDPDVALSVRDVRRACQARLEAVMVPRDVLFVSELPKTSSGKVRKQDLRDMARDS